MLTRAQREDKLAREQWAEERRNARQGRFEGTQFITGAELIARDDFNRQKELQSLKDIGQMELRDRQEAGATERTNLEQLDRQHELV